MALQDGHRHAVSMREELPRLADQLGAQQAEIVALRAAVDDALHRVDQLIASRLSRLRGHRGDS